jgi:hypothetical protein
LASYMKKNSYISAVICLLAFLLLGGGCERGEDTTAERPSVSASILSEGPFTIGDPIDILITVISDRESRARFPEEEQELFPFTVRGITQKRSRLAKNTYRTLIIYTVAVFRTGPVTLPSLPVTVGERILRTEPLDIHILSVLPIEEEALQLKDVVPPYRPRTRKSTIMFVLASLVAAAAAAYFLYRFWKRTKGQKREFVPPEEAEVDPYRYSISELERVKAGFTGATMSTKQIYLELSFIMRCFIGSMFRLNAVQMTTGQLSKLLRRKKAQAVPYRRLVNLLKRSDLVKFAKERPVKEQVRTDIEESIGIVKEVHGTVEKAQIESGKGT